MKINGKNAAIFLAGAAIGAVVSAIVTRNVVDETYRKAADDEIFKAWQEAKKRSKGYTDRIQELEEKVSQQTVTINTLADQVRSCGAAPKMAKKDEKASDEAEDDPGRHISEGEREDARENYVRYAKKYGNREAEGVEFPAQEAAKVRKAVREEEKIEKRGPVLIDETAFNANRSGNTQTDLFFYLGDGKVLSEDNEWIDPYASFVGEEWRKYARKDGDEIYVRNDYLGADYRIEAREGYGEDHISLSPDPWDDED